MPENNNAQSLSLKDFYRQLSQHDWYYRESDDTHVYNRGHERNEELKKTAQQSAQHQELFDGFYNYAWRNGEKPIEPIEKREIYRYWDNSMANGQRMDQAAMFYHTKNTDSPISEETIKNMVIGDVTTYKSSVNNYHCIIERVQ